MATTKCNKKKRAAPILTPKQMAVGEALHDLRWWIVTRGWSRPHGSKVASEIAKKITRMLEENHRG